jgi:hypothetical protein
VGGVLVSTVQARAKTRGVVQQPVAIAPVEAGIGSPVCG